MEYTLNTHVASPTLRIRRLSFFLAALASLIVAAPCQAEQTPSSCSYTVAATLPVTMAGSIHLPTIEGTIQGQAATLLLDTGATQSYLMRAPIEKLGIFIGKPSSIATGSAGAASRSVTRPSSFAIGPIFANRPYMFVLNDLAFKPFFDAIAGVDFLLSMDMEVSLAEKYVKFYQGSGCEQAFLANDANASVIPFVRVSEDDSRPQFNVTIQGQTLRAIIDTGARSSSIDVKAAARLGITPQSPGVLKGPRITGAGKVPSQSWSAQFEDISIGKEHVKSARMLITDADAHDPSPTAVEIIIGDDFLQSHRVLFAMGQRRIYVTKIGETAFTVGR